MVIRRTGELGALTKTNTEREEARERGWKLLEIKSELKLSLHPLGAMNEAEHRIVIECLFWKMII